MQITGVTREQLAVALWEIMPNGTGTFTALNAKGTRWNVKLTVKNAGGDYGRRGRMLTKAGENRKIAALCWHGFRDFMAALFEVAPEAVIRSAMATYKGRAHFEDTYRATGDRNIGSLYEPMYASEACECGWGA